MELVLPMYNMRPYFSLKNLGGKYTLYAAKYGSLYSFKKLNLTKLEAYFVIIYSFCVFFFSFLK